MAEIAVPDIDRSEAALPTAFTWAASIARRAENFAIPLLAIVAGLVIFAIFIACFRKSPFDLYELMYKGGFGSWFSIQNTLLRAAPLLLAALCVALPARLGLVIIGGEGAIVLGGLAAAAIVQPLAGLPPALVIFLMGAAGVVAGGVWIGFVGALRAYRGVNETIASLLMAYCGIALLNFFVEGPLRDPASLNKPSTKPIGASYMVGNIPGTDVHWGLVAGVVACILAWVLIEKTTWGFAARIAGGNVRAARAQGLPVGLFVVAFTALGGGMAGLAGMFEVAAVQGSASGSLAAGYGYSGILIAFLARQNPLAIIPAAIFLGGLEASNGLIQRRMDLPDATVLVLEGILLLCVLMSETLYGRFKIFNPHLWKAKAA